MPLALSAYYAGLTSDEFVDDFEHYAKTVFKAYNGCVKTWYTFNEPHVCCDQIAGYSFTTTISPNATIDNAMYHCAYYTLRAHAKAEKAFRDMGIEGEIASKNDGFVGRPWRTNTTEDYEAVERNTAFWVINIERDDACSIHRGRKSRDKSFWVAAPENSIAACLANSRDPIWPNCYITPMYDSETGWPIGIAVASPDSWLLATPQNLRYGLKEYQKQWPSEKIYLSEFGLADAEEGNRTDLSLILDDADRTNYYMTMLGEALLAIHEDNIPVAGLFARMTMISTCVTNQALTAGNTFRGQQTERSSTWAPADFLQFMLMFSNLP